MKLSSHAGAQAPLVEYPKGITNGPDLSKLPLLTPTQAQILFYALFGLKLSEISIITKLPEDQIDRMLASADMLASTELLKDRIVAGLPDIRHRIRNAAPTAFGVIEALLLNAPASRDKLAAAKDILDRAGYTPVTRHEVHTTTHISPEDAALIAETLDQTRAIDAQFSVIKEVKPDATHHGLSDLSEETPAP